MTKGIWSSHIPNVFFVRTFGLMVITIFYSWDKETPLIQASLYIIFSPINKYLISISIIIILE
ncbi:hypothetical protein [Lysinibacillus sp. JNUCC 51]|uniref:hypothetical protein n=1 Tax=Lysinibacillus sp. JNUCC-51 TaxID=2792479 RepID=UPI0019381D31|nr:hypothetical protein JNUCC51_22345 [Lysinibacillus sp. JNUCC-51]